MDNGTLAQAAAAALEQVLRGLLTATSQAVGDQFLGILSRHFRSSGKESVLDAYQKDPTSPVARGAFVQSLTNQLRDDAGFRQQVSNLINTLTTQDSSVRSNVSASYGSMAVGGNFTSTTNSNKKEVHTGGLIVGLIAVVTVVAVVVLAVVIGPKVVGAVNNGINSAQGLTGDSTCSDYLASSDVQDKMRVMKQLYLHDNKPQQAADPFIVQNTEYFCGGNSKQKLSDLAAARGSN